MDVFLPNVACVGESNHVYLEAILQENAANFLRLLDFFTCSASVLRLQKFENVRSSAEAQKFLLWFAKGLRYQKASEFPTLQLRCRPHRLFLQPPPSVAHAPSVLLFLSVFLSLSLSLSFSFLSVSLAAAFGRPCPLVQD